MNLDISARPGKSGYNDPVPSRYALRVGEIDVMVISDGVLTTVPSVAMATNADPAVWAAWQDMAFMPDDLEWPLNTVVVRSGNQTILIDAGLGEVYPPFPRAGRLGLRLEAAGIDLGSVTDIVLTHMHFDHVGGLLMDGVRDRLRPDLRIHASAAEVEFWASPDFSRTAMPPEFPDMIRSVAQRFLAEYRSYLTPFREKHEVAPGVVASRTGGHTPGHSVIRIASGGDRLMFAGDLLFPVSFDHPEWHNGFEHDPEEAARIRARLLRELADTGSLLVATHMPFPSVCHVAAVGDTYRCVPAFWDY